MLDFIVKYWLQELFGLIVIILGFVGKRAWKQYTKARQMIQDVKDGDRAKKIMEKIDEKFDETKNQFKEIVLRLDTLEAHDKKQDEQAEIRKQGILALQRKQFLAQGKELLNPSHIITYDEYVDYSNQHELYNSLGGNHEGDEQYKLVTTKYQTGLQNK